MSQSDILIAKVFLDLKLNPAGNEEYITKGIHPGNSPTNINELFPYSGPVQDVFIKKAMSKDMILLERNGPDKNFIAGNNLEILLQNKLWILAARK